MGSIHRSIWLITYFMILGSIAVESDSDINQAWSSREQQSLSSPCNYTVDIYALTFNCYTLENISIFIDEMVNVNIYFSLEAEQNVLFLNLIFHQHLKLISAKK